MERFTGTCEPFASVEVEGIVGWISAIPYSTWPQQSQTELKPAMVTDIAWNGFGATVHDVVVDIMNSFPECSPFQRMLSVVMPGNYIEPHTDGQAPYWVTRVHVPLIANDMSYTRMDDGDHYMQVGIAYKMNTLATHAVYNEGVDPRLHFMFDVRNV